MPREVEYWRRRHLGQCVECDVICSTARCGACQERRRLQNDRSGVRERREPGIKRRLAGHREARERREAWLRTGTRQGLGPKPSKAVVRRMEREQARLRLTAPRPRDGKLPGPDGLQLDGIDVEWWAVGGESWRWPEAFATAEVRLASAPEGWLPQQLRWITLAWGDGAMEVEIFVATISGADMKLDIKSVPS